MRLFAVDPGKSSGYALFEDGVLIDCGAGAPGKDFVIPPLHMDILVIERPEIYRGSRVNPNNLVTLAITAGWWTGVVTHEKLLWVVPKMWKGQIPKTPRLQNYIIYKRVKDVLYSSWDNGLTQKQKFDAIDAVGIGRYAIENAMWLI